jgi:hypothetical protein
MIKESCPNCLGSKQVMIAKATRGFTYKDCNYCDKNGLVTVEQEEDFILSKNEELLIEKNY